MGKAEDDKVAAQFDVLEKGASDAVDAAQQDLKLVQQLKSDVEAAKVAYGAEQFDEGVKQNGTPGDKIFSLEEMNAELKPLQDKIVALEASVASLEQAAQAHPTAIAEAVEAKQAEMLADIESADVDNQALIQKYKKVEVAPKA